MLDNDYDYLQRNKEYQMDFGLYFLTNCFRLYSYLYYYADMAFVTLMVLIQFSIDFNK